jgi:acetyltransferase-like isoleucine patch superfamily enzyme
MVSNSQYPAHLLRAQRKTALMLALLGSIPLFVGRKLRRFAYRFICKRIGANATIQTDVELVGAQSISIGNRSGISRNVLVSCWDPGSQIILHDDVTLDRGVQVSALGGRIEINDRTFIGPYTCIAGPGDIKVGKNCLIASHSSMYANNHNFADIHIPINQQGLTSQGIVIEDDCWLGTGVRVLDGVTIGKGSVIGAGAVVTKSIPPYSIAVGVPAKVIDKRGSTPRSKLMPIGN